MSIGCLLIVVFAEALDVRAGGGLECGIALRVGPYGAWVVMAASVICRRGYRCDCLVEYNLPGLKNQGAIHPGF
jgi:hypothetical protein